MPVAAAVIDADFIRQAAAEETVREHPVVVSAQTHAIHVVAISGRVVARHMAGPALSSRRR